MATITLKYNAHNSVVNQMIETRLRSDAKIVEPKKERNTEKEEVLKAYQKMFGIRKDNKYTDNEIFVFNSQLNASKTFAKYF